MNYECTLTLPKMFSYKLPLTFTFNFMGLTYLFSFKLRCKLGIKHDLSIHPDFAIQQPKYHAILIFEKKQKLEPSATVHVVKLILHVCSSNSFVFFSQKIKEKSKIPRNIYSLKLGSRLLSTSLSFSAIIFVKIKTLTDILDKNTTFVKCFFNFKVAIYT